MWRDGEGFSRYSPSQSPTATALPQGEPNKFVEIFTIAFL